MPSDYSTVPEQSFLLRRALGGRQPEVAVRRGRGHPPPRGPLEESLLNEERLAHALARVPLTWAKARTRLRSRIATRGVPRERRAISREPSSSMGIEKDLAALRITSSSSAGE